MNNEEVQYAGKRIFENRHHLARRLCLYIQEYLDEHSESFHVPESKCLRFRSEIMGHFGESLYMDQQSVFSSVNKCAAEAAELSIKYNVSLSLSLRLMSLFRLVIWEIITEELEQERISCHTLLKIIERFDLLLDNIYGITGEVHEKHTASRLKTVYSELEELSVPIVPISKNIAVLPVIGSINEDRARLIMNASLQESVRLKLQNLIIDLSGVTLIDSFVANLLLQIINALKLIGVKISVTGIHPSIAHTITRLGLDFGLTRIHKTLEQALADLGFKQSVLSEK
ncbi:STAS domain-containing protein [Cytobacillus sp. FSL H8-0458]|uniref:STAS domain-containing protein n=1 Tax=Cytobacillus sp. FSL H8-0458 TaxID=2975346 RepID=UPI0030F569F4